MKKIVFSAVIFVLLFWMFVSGADKSSELDIPYQKFVLGNGLTVLVHEDHKAPIVAVNVWYHVGSKDEQPGKTGFAHLFEHLMFQGSEHYNDEFFRAVEKIGATDLNGTTSEDRTNYFQNVPKSALDTILWLESDRMGHLLGAIDQAKLDEQRGVVQNEIRMYQNEPYFGVYEAIVPGQTYPKGHPYSWSVGGSIEDLSAASLKDVHEWFKKYYGPANATLVIAGDINTEEIKKKVEHFFGDIPAGPPVVHQTVNVAKMEGVKRMRAQDSVPAARFYKIWNIPQAGSDAETLLDMAANILSEGKDSPLYKRLVYSDKIAGKVNVRVDSREAGSQFIISVTALPGQDLEKIEKVTDEVLAKFMKEGPTQKQIANEKVGQLSRFLAGIEKIGDSNGKAQQLAKCQVYMQDPACYKKQLALWEKATSADIKKVMKEWLSDGQFVFEVLPFSDHTVMNSKVDRSKIPEPLTPPEALLPSMESTILANGMTLTVVPRHNVPLVQVYMQIGSGSATDVFSLPGVAYLTADMLNEGTSDRNVLQISERQKELAIDIQPYVSPDGTVMGFSGLKKTLNPSLELLSDMILRPSFPVSELSRCIILLKAKIESIKDSPWDFWTRILPPILFGKESPYRFPRGGQGFENQIEKIGVADLKAFYKEWYRPNNATLILVGDVTIKEVSPQIEKLFGSWKKGDFRKIPDVLQPIPAKPVVYLIDKPNAPQSFIVAGQLIDRNMRDDVSFNVLHEILGGAISSRLMMNIREEKHWAYFAFNSIFNTNGQQMHVALTSVQIDKTKEAIQEIIKEYKEIGTTRPPTEKELSSIQKMMVQSLAGRWESNQSVLWTYLDLFVYKKPGSYWKDYADKVNAVTSDDIKKTAQKVLRPEKLMWVIMGDREKIESSLKTLGWEIKVVDGDGNPVNLQSTTRMD